MSARACKAILVDPRNASALARRHKTLAPLSCASETSGPQASSSWRRLYARAAGLVVNHRRAWLISTAHIRSRWRSQ